MPVRVLAVQVAAVCPAEAGNDAEAGDARVEEARTHGHDGPGRGAR